MPFQLVYYSQQDAQWKNDIPGFGILIDGGFVRQA
jgi:hypothetical protein